MRLQGFTQLLNKAAHLKEQRQLYLETCQVLQSQVVTLESEKATAVISLDRVFLAALFAVWFMEGFDCSAVSKTTLLRHQQGRAPGGLTGEWRTGTG